MIIRPAISQDAGAMSAVLLQVLSGWQSDRPGDPGHVLGFYITHPDRVECSVAETPGGAVLGFQSLKRAAPGNAYGVSPGWGIIGTYVRPGYGRRGVGSALFRATLKAAQAACLPRIDATIGAENSDGLGYYDALGFRTYRTSPGAISKCYVVDFSD